MEAVSLEIWMIAGLLVDELGVGAVVIAQQRAQRALSEHDTGGNAIWRAVSAAAATYLRANRTVGEWRI